MAILTHRPRILRASTSVRSLTQEIQISADDFVFPIFIDETIDRPTPIDTMPSCVVYPLRDVPAYAKKLYAVGLRAVLLFVKVPHSQKDNTGKAACAPDGLIPRAIRAIKDAVPEMLVFTDVALDPYSSFGHDGIVREGDILNDPTVDVLCEMAVVHARAGADFVAPSDMMDGRVGAIRAKLEQSGYTNCGIMAYTAKYASAFYGPFRGALDSAPEFGDKKTYQMNPANAREACREATLDETEGADILLVKPGMLYLDVVYRLREQSRLPIAVYQVSGEYTMIKALAEKLNSDEITFVHESFLAFKRAGADIIISYFAYDYLRQRNR